ncbi:MFS transporter [Lachnoclostridium sp. An131]|jgi:UMF1 family MFS transporter|uniref:MFS transporter n=1 Tax=Lachnoclostridium sp. An131 TaxID=1965555 RepID=UPI000B367555|nr:MFS transporter [Lachnoclostridium sp. An131]OUQ25904.1 MFS transporter [Lachnoclostridium sp. An131]
MNQKLTKLEKRWILYDVGNSAFVLLTSTIIPIYYKNIASASGISDADSTAFFGYATSLVTILVAVLGPVLGTLADTKGFKKPVFTFFMMMGVLGCAGLALPTTWTLFLAVYVLAKTGLNASLVFYDAMLPDVTTDERMDVVSAQGYAWGYIGSCIPFIISLVFVLCSDLIGISGSMAMAIAFLLNAAWWLLVTLPLLGCYEQKHYVERSAHPVRDSFSRLAKVFSEVRKMPEVWFFLLAFFFYIDGVYTIIDMATSYGKDVGISDTNLLLALLLTQVVAFPCSILVGQLSKKMKNTSLIQISIVGYFFIVLFALQLDKAWEFWFLAVCVAVFQGAIQSLSRSYFARIVPKEKATEFFGFFDIFGKGAAFMGTMLMGISTQLFDTSRAGVALLAVMFAVGFVLFRIAVRKAEA